MERSGYLPGRESATFSTGLRFLELARHKGLILLAANNVTLASLRVIEHSIVNPSEVTCGTDLRTVGAPAGFAHVEHRSRSSNGAQSAGATARVQANRLAWCFTVLAGGHMNFSR